MASRSGSAAVRSRDPPGRVRRRPRQRATHFEQVPSLTILTICRRPFRLSAAMPRNFIRILVGTGAWNPPASKENG